MIPCVVNQLLHWTETNRVERVLWIDHSGAGLYAIDIASDTALPCFWNEIYLDAALADEQLVLGAQDPWIRIVSEESLTGPQRQRRDAAWSIIRPLLQQQPNIFTTDLRGPLVRRAMQEHGVTNQTVYRLLRRYWQRGMTPNALLPDYHNSGAAGKERTAGENKRGRPRIYGDGSGVNVDMETRKRFRAAITVHFAKNRKQDLPGAYQALLDRYYSESELDEGTGQQRIVRLRDHPTMAQFSYWYAKDNDIFKIERARRTSRVYDKDLRGILGSSTAETIGPGSRYQIDATIADVYLLSRYDRNKIIGRPVLYVVIDVFSRLVVGVYVGLEGPSWVGAMMALANVASDKVEFCQRFGLNIRPDEWPCQALPEVLLSDRGETAGKAIETLIQMFNVHVETAAPFRADWKGIVEQEFRLIQADFAPYVPGYIQTDYQERGGGDYRLDATLDIDQFTYVILCCIRNHNNFHQIKGYHRDPDMVADDVAPVPVELWEWGIQRRSGRLRVYPEEMVRLSLLPSEDVSVTEQGILFYGCLYSCRKALEEHWFDRARQKGRWKIRASYDPRCMDTLYLHDAREAFIPCTLTERSADFRNMSLWEIDQVRRLDRQMTAHHAPAEMVGRLNLTRDIKVKIAEAEAQKAAEPTTPVSKKARTAKIRDNRAEEKNALRERDAFRPTVSPVDQTKVLPFPSAAKKPEDDDDLSLSEVTPSLLAFRQETADDDE